MPRSRTAAKPSETPTTLKGWKQIAEFLGQPVGVAQGWGRSGMPVQLQGRSVTASAEELSGWVARESGSTAPVHIAGGESDLAAELKRGLAVVKQKGKGDARKR